MGHPGEGQVTGQGAGFYGLPLVSGASVEKLTIPD